MGLSCRPVHLRTRLFNLRSGALIHRSDRRKSHRGSGFRWYFHRGSGHYLSNSTACQAADFLWTHWWHVRYCLCCRPSGESLPLCGGCSSFDASTSLVEFSQTKLHGGGASTSTVMNPRSFFGCLSLTQPVPLGAVTAAGLLIFLKFNQAAKRERLSFGRQILRFDPIGTALFVPAVVCLLLALQWGGVQYPWSDGRVIALFVLFGLLTIAFVGVQIWLGEDATGEIIHLFLLRNGS